MFMWAQSDLHQSIVVPFWTYKTCIPIHIRHTALEDARHNLVFHVMRQILSSMMRQVFPHSLHSIC